MEYSTNFNFALPSRDNDVDLADINEISNNFRKVDENAVIKEVGKGLSTNDFTNEEKAKLANALLPENIDQTYSATSTNAQSGTAVAEAVKKAGVRKIRHIELGAGQTANMLKISTDEDGNPFELNEAFFTAHLVFDASGTTSNLRIRADGGNRYIVLKTGLSLSNGIITCGGTINAHGGILSTTATYSTTDNPQAADSVYGMIAKTTNITHNLKDIEVLIYGSAVYTELKEGSFLELWGC